MYQLVALDAPGGPGFLVAEDDPLAVEVAAIAAGTDRYGLFAVTAPALAAQPLLPLVASSGLHSRWASQSATAELEPGQLADLAVLLRNTGDRTGTADQVLLGTNAPPGSTAAVDSGLVPAPLYNRDRLATHAEPLVAPGEVGTFSFRVRAPDAPGTYRIHVRPVVEGVAWLEDEGIYLEIVVR